MNFFAQKRSIGILIFQPYFEKRKESEDRQNIVENQLNNEKVMKGFRVSHIVQKYSILP